MYDPNLELPALYADDAANVKAESLDMEKIIFRFNSVSKHCR